MAVTQSTDTCTNNFAILTTVDASPAVFSDGNLKVTSSTTNSYRGGTSSIGLPPGSGKWYCEALATGSTGSNKEYVFGAAVNSTEKVAGYFPGTSGQTANGANDEHGYYSGSGGIVYSGSSNTSSVGEYDGGDLVALRFDMDTSSPTCKFYVNNTLKHTANLTAGLTYFPHFNVQDQNLDFKVNFGAGNPPSAISSVGLPGGFTYLADFDGSNDHGTFSAVSGVNSGGGPITIAAWVRVDSAPGNPPGGTVMGIAHIGGGSGGLGLSMDGADGNLEVVASIPGTLAFRSSDANINVGDFNFIAITHAGGNVNSTNTFQYKNGVVLTQDGSGGSTTPTLTTGGNIGRSPDPNYFNGVIGHVMIWNEVLSAAELLALYNGGTVLSPTANSGNYTSSSGLKHYFKLDSNSTMYDTAAAASNSYVNQPAGSAVQGRGFADANGHGDFVYEPPTGHLSINTKNLFAASAPTIEDGSAFFQTMLWSGTGNVSRTINTQTGNSNGQQLTFVPDMLWIKERNHTNPSNIFDEVRSEGSKNLQPVNTNAEDTEADWNDFVDGGFSVTGNGQVASLNTSSRNYVGWTWKAGASNTVVSESGTGDDAIAACTHRANQTAGFSIVKYQGKNDEISNGQHTKVAHGLGVKPTLIIGKNLAAGTDWFVMSIPQQNDAHMHLNTTAENVGSDFTGTWSDSDATHFVVGNDDLVNKAGADFISYVWAEVPGFSKFGKFSSGSSGDPFVHCGFTPALIFLKRISSADDWYVHDTVRDPNNPAFRYLKWNDTPVEASNSAVFIDIISNGFVCDLGSIVTTNDDMIFGAWATNPFVGSAPATAR